MYINNEVENKIEQNQNCQNFSIALENNIFFKVRIKKHVKHLLCVQQII